MQNSTDAQQQNYQYDLDFLSQHTSVLTLRSEDGEAQVVLAPEWQGRVMTSTNDGGQGDSYGWINYDLVKKGIAPPDQRTGLEQHIYVFGGEERMWLGPEGGQFALFFDPSADQYDFDSWKTPAILDTEPFTVENATEQSVSFAKSGSLINKAGTRLDFDIQRTVTLLDDTQIANLLGVVVDAQVKSVAYTSANKLTNTGKRAWEKETGVPSIWMLGMLKPDERVVMAIPIRQSGAGNPVNADYFGEVPEDRLVVRDGTVFFKGDGKFRSKIGIPPGRATPFVGSYSPQQKTLTLLNFQLPDKAASLPYVRSQWEHHVRPYAGDVINCYNDGSPEPGADPLGPFYELESSSPALELKPAESYTHTQTTFHLKGDRESLDPIAKKWLNIDIATFESAFENK